MSFQGKIPDLDGHVYDVKTNDPTKRFQQADYRLGLIEWSLTDISYCRPR
jgi:hypothetical protein